MDNTQITIITFRPSYKQIHWNEVINSTDEEFNIIECESKDEAHEMLSSILYTNYHNISSILNELMYKAYDDMTITILIGGRIYFTNNNDIYINYDNYNEKYEQLAKEIFDGAHKKAINKINDKIRLIEEVEENKRQEKKRLQEIRRQQQQKTKEQQEYETYQRLRKKYE